MPVTQEAVHVVMEATVSSPRHPASIEAQL
jgi:hypothetical protein